ncbi:ribose-phosphate pyrophosphokinase [Mechercharimyces sp. CAU 1602]|uniref:ribose-phosphate diphosphokinase n=1 Tax=Mechercharimyces sp. CAU 1602 TaxID=2973933 RepID=UPI00216387FA|nr:ribose-phosphate pyrophosphokinase [Mechercharimyces sp. CAU 1602]MCS1352206.1 ribose-phosphate pyrophosphokinase [Mechercharimyces sp. CAU 1602]
MDGHRAMIFTGTSNPELASAIADQLGTTLGDARIDRFQSGEVYVHYEESVRNADVYLVQTMSHPINDILMELLIMADAARRASAGSVNAVIPYFGYARQEKKDAPREPISAKVVADLLHTVGIDRVITIDLHAPAIQGFFHIPVDHLTALGQITTYLRQKRIDHPVVVSPDAGRVKTAEKLATSLDAPFAVMLKKRPSHHVASITHVIGEVKGHTPIIIEDMIDTGGTIVNVVDHLREKGAKKAVVCASHPIFSGMAHQRLDHHWIEKVVITDTLPLRHLSLGDRFKVLSVAPMLSEAIRLIQTGGSLSTMFRSGM